MPPATPKLDHELLVRVKTIMVLRLVFLTGFVFLIIAFERNATREIPTLPLSAVLCTAYFFALLYALLLRFQLSLNLLAWMQVIGDLFIVGGLIYTTGGVESPLSFLFLFVIISTSVMLPRSACYKAAAGASIIYGLLVDLEYFNLIRPVYFFPKSHNSYQGAFLFYTVVMNLASFFAVAYLCSILTHRLRLVKEELEEKSLNLQQLEAFHSSVVQNMGNGLLTTDLQGRITSANAACEKITGFPLADLEGRPCYEILPIPALASLFKEPGNRSFPILIENDCVLPNGQAIRIGMKITHLNDSASRLSGFICVFEDLTEIRKMEEVIRQNEQLAAVGRFSAGLAHEIRNPLASLSGSIQVLRKNLKLAEQDRQLMEIVLKETERLNAIVCDFLNFSHPNRNKTRMVDLTQLLQDLILLMKNSNEYNPAIKIELDVPNDHFLIESDEEQIKQMVWNLCINGIQSMDQEGTLSIALKPTQGFSHNGFSTPRKGVVLSVQDEGRGISEEQIKLIFDPFYTTRDEGVGLGLATVKKIVERFGGYIGVTSQPGAGTRFEVFLPQERELGNSRPPDKEMRQTAGF